MFVIEIHNPYAPNTHDFERYRLIFKTLKRSFTRTHPNIHPEHVLPSWRGFLRAQVTNGSPKDEFFAVSARELALLPPETRNVRVVETVKRASKKETTKARRAHAAKVKAKRNTLSSKKKLSIRRADRVCRYCLGAPAQTVDHVIPLSRGGTNDPRNLVGCCLACNELKQSNLPKEAGLTLHVPLRFFDL